MNKSMLNDGRWIIKHYAELSEKYGMEYIAVSNRKVIAHDPSYAVVKDKAKRKSKDYMISYVESGDQIITPFLCSDFS